tara:strand:+ start:367 stop:1314 length:948 start_codon:yes stop_codon:yes gene_type:complete
MPNMQSIIFCTFFLFSLASCTSSQLTAEDQPSAQIFRISNGLEVALTPPKNFSITQEHYGFIQPESFSRIRISEKEFAYNSYIEKLSKENLLKNQLQLVKKEQVEISGAICSLLTLRQNIAGVYFEKMWLISGDNLSSVQVEASYPESAPKKLKNAIKTSLLSLTVATDLNLRLYTALPFQFSQTPNFSIKKRYANSIVLLPLGSVDAKESITVSHGKISQEIEDIKILSDHFLKKGKHFKNVEILKTEMIKIDNIPALAATAYVELNKRPTFVYQILSYQKSKFLLIQGQTPKKEKKEFKFNVDRLMEHFSFKK